MGDVDAESDVLTWMYGDIGWANNGSTSSVLGLIDTILKELRLWNNKSAMFHLINVDRMTHFLERVAGSQEVVALLGERLLESHEYIKKWRLGETEITKTVILISICRVVKALYGTWKLSKKFIRNFFRSVSRKTVESSPLLEKVRWNQLLELIQSGGKYDAPRYGSKM